MLITTLSFVEGQKDVNYHTAVYCLGVRKKGGACARGHWHVGGLHMERLRVINERLAQAISRRRKRLAPSALLLVVSLVSIFELFDCLIFYPETVDKTLVSIVCLALSIPSSVGFLLSAISGIREWSLIDKLAVASGIAQKINEASQFKLNDMYSALFTIVAFIEHPLEKGYVYLSIKKGAKLEIDPLLNDNSSLAKDEGDPFSEVAASLRNN